MSIEKYIFLENFQIYTIKYKLYIVIVLHELCPYIIQCFII